MPEKTKFARLRTAAGTLLALGAIAATPLVFAACSTPPAQHTYWLQNPNTGTYTPHKTYSALSDDEIRELGLVKTLPEGARVSE